MRILWPKRRWLQFSLRTSLVLVTLCAIACSWLAVKIQQAKREEAAAAALVKLGGYVEWEGLSWQPTSFRTVLGEHFLAHVKRVSLQGRNVNDSTLELLNVLDQLSELELYFTGVTDAGLEHLQRLQELRLLDLRGTDLTDAGLQKLAGLKQLAHLELSDSKLATAILERDGVSGNDENERLTPGTFPLFTRSRITETGMGKLQRALPNCKSEMGL